MARFVIHGKGMTLSRNKICTFKPRLPKRAENRHLTAPVWIVFINKKNKPAWYLNGEINNSFLGIEIRQNNLVLTPVFVTFMHAYPLHGFY